MFNFAFIASGRFSICRRTCHIVKLLGTVTPSRPLLNAWLSGGGMATATATGAGDLDLTTRSSFAPPARPAIRKGTVRSTFFCLCLENGVRLAKACAGGILKGVDRLEEVVSRFHLQGLARLVEDIRHVSSRRHLDLCRPCGRGRDHHVGRHSSAKAESTGKCRGGGRSLQ